MRSKSILKTSGISLLLIAGLVMKVGCDSGVGFLGLQDYQRDLLVGGLAAALLANQANAPADDGAGQTVPVEGEQGQQGPAGEAGADGSAGSPGAQGPTGPAGPAGPAGANGSQGEPGATGASGSAGATGPQGAEGAQGPNYFDIFIDDFFTTEEGPTGGLLINFVEIVEPVIGARDPSSGVAGGAVAFRVGIPQTYDEAAGNDVTMRLYLYRTGRFNERCFVMSVIAKRLRHGSDVEDYGETRYVRIRFEDFAVGDDPSGGILVVVDLPINIACDGGLGLPDDLGIGETLAFELATYDGMGDGGAYQMLGVEFFESANGTASLQGAKIFCDAGGVTCEDETGPCPGARTFTVNGDFDEGTLTGLEHETVADQLQIAAETTTLPILWVANAAEDSISKWNTETNREEARYHTWFGPLGTHDPWEGAAPSRTAVDLEGNCYVANRHFDNRAVVVFKILSDGFVDRNGNGVMDTSSDGDSSGTISPSEMLPMTDTNADGIIDDSEIADERIAWAVRVGTPGGLGRSLAIDGDGNIWVGMYNQQTYYKISGVDGSTLAGPISTPGHTPYGALVDRNGMLWGASLSNTMVQIDTTTDSLVSVRAHSLSNYGIALGRDDAGATVVYLGRGNSYHRFDTATETFSNPSATSFATLGIAVDGSGNIVCGDSNSGAVTKYAPDGSVIWSAPSQGVGAARGTVIDANGDVWIIHVSNDALSKFDGDDGTALGTFTTGRGPYTYSDATGLGLRTAFPTGIWTVNFDGGAADFVWIGGDISWSSQEPAGTTVTVRVRSSNDEAVWSGWEDVSNGSPLTTTPMDQYLQIQTTMKISAGETSPVLFDLTVNPPCDGGEDPQ